ncbi:MAG: sulfite exporter TauE/SafE family protein [Puniceicoccaceae bacterium]
MTPLDWMIVMLGALLVGLGKGGIVGVGNLTVILFAMVFEAKASVGLLLPVLISADIVAITVYRRHADWTQLGRLLPWMLVGIVIGYFLFGRMSDLTVRRLIGGIVLAMTMVQIWRTLARQAGKVDFAERIPHTFGFRSSLGLLGGFATMVANAAGPVGQLYFISVGLPKLVFIGTSAWCFFIVNVVKVPLQAHLGIINLESLQISLALAPFAMAGAAVAPKVVKFIPQKIFTIAVWFFIVLAGVKLTFF